MPQSAPRPETEDVFTMQPRRLTRKGSAAREPLKTPPAFVSITFCQSEGFVFVTVLPAKMPALLTITSRPPNVRTADSTAASTSPYFATSATRTSVRSFGSSFATRATLLRWSPTSTTAAPSSEKRRAVASPMPDPAPVTITTLPSKRIGNLRFSWGGFDTPARARFGTKVPVACRKLPVNCPKPLAPGSGMRVLCIVVGCVALLAGLAAGAQATFAPQVDYVAGTPNGVPRSVHLGDFNGDGNIDLLVLNQDADDVAILLGNGDGTFRPAQVFPVGNTPAGAVVLDLDGDGRLDVVVANFGSNDISVLLGNGDGTLRPQVRIPLSGGPSAVVAGDFDGDGKVDIAVTLRSAGGVATFFGNGDGTFRRGVTLVTDDSPFFPVTADFNGDGRSDLAVATFSKHGVAIFLGQGDGTFAPQQVYVIAGATVAGLVVGDFNDDGHLDIATANTTPATVAILLGNGDGTFQAPVTWPANGSLFIAATDLDRDGIPDLAVTANAGGRLAILRGVGDGTFAPPAFVGNTAITFGIAAADFDGDG